VQGQSKSGAGVFGASETGQGVTGESTSGVGVFGVSEPKPGVQGESTSGPGVFGHSETGQGVTGESTSGVGVFGVSETKSGVIGRGTPAGWFQGKLKVDDVPAAPNQERFLVWDADNLVKYRALPASGGGFDGTLVDKPIYLINANGDTVFSVTTDGKSIHKGEETFLGGIRLTDENDGPGLLIEQRSIITFDENGRIVNILDPAGALFLKKVALQDTFEIQDANGNVTTQFLPDGTSLHKGDEMFEGDVILKGTGGKGIKLVDANGETLAGFGREDLETGQRIGVFGKAENPGDLAASFEGEVDVIGEITANSLHIVNTDGDSLVDFFADGTSRHKGLEKYQGGIQVVNSDGSVAVEMKPDANPSFQFGLTVEGNVRVNGMLQAESKQFRIDHPLDPENKYLHHTSVESPEMKNVYDGVINLDEKGEAWIELPEWFEALNKDFRYQLTCIGGFANVYIEEEIQNNRFKIAGGRPDLKVSWQVTGIRDDAFARANRNPVESMK
jgi:hypothetical protein